MRPRIDRHGVRQWREEELQKLPVRDGFRLRGLEMTRLETFADAAFAFALTLLVISVDEIPDSIEAFREALRSTPAFVASFIQLTMFWMGHRAWSRSYGLDDTTSVWISIALIAGVLVIVYPLRVMFASGAAFMTGGWAPAPFELDLDGIRLIFIVYGLSFSVLCGLVALLYVHAYRLREPLGLNELERYDARGEMLDWGILSGFGLFAALLAVVLDGVWAALSGWSYALLAIIMPALVWWLNRNRPPVPGDDAD